MRNDLIFGLVSTGVRCNNGKREPGADMAIDPLERSPRYLARLVLLLLLAIPLLPEIVIGIAAALAGLMGCRPDQKDACLIGSLAVNDAINWALQAGGVSIVASATERTYLYLAIGGWLVACYVVLIWGWKRVRSRLLLGSAVALYLALVPFWGPMLAIKMLADRPYCEPAGSGGCTLFGGKVNQAYAALSMADPPPYYESTKLAVGIFAVYAILVIVQRVVSARRPVKSRRENF